MKEPSNVWSNLYKTKLVSTEDNLLQYYRNNFKVEGLTALSILMPMEDTHFRNTQIKHEIMQKINLLKIKQVVEKDNILPWPLKPLIKLSAIF